MNLKPESYKGISIGIVSKIIGNKKWVYAKWMMKGRSYKLRDVSKMVVLGRAKQIIDKMLK